MENGPVRNKGQRSKHVEGHIADGQTQGWTTGRIKHKGQSLKKSDDN